MLISLDSFITRLKLRKAAWLNRQRLKRIALDVGSHESPNADQAPVVVMNVSSRLTGLSLNAAYTMLVGWALRLAGVPVVHFVCKSGLSHCVLGTNRQDYRTPPPCKGCLAQSQRIYRSAKVNWFALSRYSDLQTAIQDLDVEELAHLEFPLPIRLCFEEPIPLGRITLPAIRWSLRRHHLPNDDQTRYLFKQYILSAYSLAIEFADLLDRLQPQACLIFNGIMYPEAAAFWIARQRGIRVVTQEVGFQPYSGFFTEGEATAYPILIPEDFELNKEQNALLDAYLEKRFRGKFSMAGIQFWPQMKALDEDFIKRAAGFKQIVPVFTNVIYDTSQVHANTIFNHMFTWLDHILKIIHSHPDTLFVIRAHPDEMRPGTAKQSRESVHDWVYSQGVDKLSNVVYIDSQEYISSYELIQRSKFLMVYNSSIGLEAALMSKPVLCAGKARYTQYPTVYLPRNVSEFHSLAEDLLKTDQIDLPIEFYRNARRFLYYQLYRASLPFGDYLQAGPRAGFVQLGAFDLQKLLPENSLTMRLIVDGILHTAPVSVGKTFMLPENLEKGSESDWEDHRSDRDKKKYHGQD